MITKDTKDFFELDFNEGQIILIDKPSGWSSFKVVYTIRKITGVKKAGHAGTLDPIASGLLIIATGRKTKEIHNYQAMEKTYSGIITLGKTTPSMDTETEVISEQPVKEISKEKINEIRTEFVGTILQVPPMYSALKHKGKNLYKYARKGKEVERKPREVFVSKFIIKRIAIPDVEFEIACSKGTYIRAIANDFGNKLGCGGILGYLRREQIGPYSVNSAFSINEFIDKYNYKKELHTST
jgi:tRNA pseudouridine55 synthase